jgi:hypothetical protein
MMASATRNVLRDPGTARPSTAHTPIAKLISVAEGIAQPRSASALPRFQRHIDGGRHHETPDRRDHRQRRLPHTCERALAGLALDLEADEQEEDRHQPVVDPMLERLGEADRSDPDLAGQVQQGGVIGFERRIGDQQGGERRDRKPQTPVQVGTIAFMRWRRRIGFRRHEKSP